ncbi:MAG TPA: phosphodiester glycosidase family protein [Candidatus Kapabacteria bacterium]|nr:phosphodiester glycosidase family protein [Candidatus Kapabacteria bacterium]
MTFLQTRTHTSPGRRLCSRNTSPNPLFAQSLVNQTDRSYIRNGQQRFAHITRAAFTLVLALTWLALMPAIESANGLRRAQAHTERTPPKKRAAAASRSAAKKGSTAKKGNVAKNGNAGSSAHKAAAAKNKSSRSSTSRSRASARTAAKHPLKARNATAASVSHKGRRGSAAHTAPAPIPHRVAMTTDDVIRADSTTIMELADGITHRRIRTQGSQVANVVTVDLKAGARLCSYKALCRYDGLANAADIATLAQQRTNDTVLAATNASFWRAGSNSPIGPTITNGEVVEMPGYKQWSSLMIFQDGTAAINRISLSGDLFWKSRHFQVSAVNRRGGAEGIVVYNHHYGDSVPMGSRKSDSAIVAEAFANRVLAESGDDSEGTGVDTAAVIRSYRESKVLEDREHSILKIACQPVRPRRRRDPLPAPAVGDTMRLVVTAVDTGAVAVPENGYVLSLGIQAEWFSVVQTGDTIGLLYTISPAPAKPVRDMLTGTPRLVRDGIANPEYETEGSKARRFVDGKLARTAVGISKDGDTLILATVNSGCSCTETSGMTLSQLAAFMKSQGAYQAMNFDGGGSASMAINGLMISRQGSGPSTRRVSNALMAVRPFQTPKRSTPKSND